MERTALMVLAILVTPLPTLGQTFEICTDPTDANTCVAMNGQEVDVADAYSIRVTSPAAGTTYQLFVGDDALTLDPPAIDNANATITWTIQTDQRAALSQRTVHVRADGDTTSLASVTFPDLSPQGATTFEICTDPTDATTCVAMNGQDVGDADAYSIRVMSPAAGTTYRLFVGDDALTLDPPAIDNANGTITWTIQTDQRAAISQQTVSITSDGGTTSLASVTFPNFAAQTPPAASAGAWVRTQRYAQRLQVTPYGLVLPRGAPLPDPARTMVGPNFVHVYFDQHGNSLFTTTPQGIAGMQYVVHVVYRQGDVTYSVNQTSGSFTGDLLFQSADVDLAGIIQRASLAQGPWAEEIVLLSTSETDIGFDIQATTGNETKAVKSHTIDMSPVYHGSIDVALLHSTLESPTYALVDLPGEDGKKTISESAAGNRGVVAVMATFYASPVILLQKIFGERDVPNFQLYGRNLLHDHEWYERVYPAVGVGINEKTFENLFFGFNFEFARGGRAFVGGHYGKVNTFSGPEGFMLGKTEATEADLKLGMDTAWEADWVLGFNLDVSIVKNLFK